MILPDEQATLAAGARLGAVLRAGDVVLLSGGLGAGKTSLARGMLRGLDYVGDVASPTFPIMLDYRPPDTRMPLTHADLYRIEDRAELDQLDLGAVLAEGALVVEWPERLAVGAWPKALRLSLSADGDGRRLTGLAGSGWGNRWPLR